MLLRLLLLLLLLLLSLLLLLLTLLVRTAFRFASKPTGIIATVIWHLPSMAAENVNRREEIPGLVVGGKPGHTQKEPE